MSMFDALMRRGTGLVERRAVARRGELAARIGEAAPDGVAVAVEGEAVVMSGRGLVRRFMVEPALRWLVSESRNGR
jgi:hypothetical protein